MKRGWPVVGWWLLAVISAHAGELVVATYNIENYVATNRLIPDGYRQEYPKPEAAKAALRRVIGELQADVLVLQEMGPRPYLEELQRDLASDGISYPVAVLLEGPDPDRHVAVLSRLPLAEVRQHRELDFKYIDGREVVKRGLLEAKLATANGPVTLWALHLKSRYTDREDDPASARRRAGEAMAIREFILDRHPDPEEAQFVILGDFNDTKRSAALRYLTRKGSKRIAELLPATDSRGEAWTHHYRREDAYTRVDHILVSPGLLHAVKERRVRIHDGPGVKAASDHRPVVLTLELEAGPEKSGQRDQQRSH
ncbi:MAG: endonuclease/exonuclease/phosphatase family protein [Opitutaceae bacterium]|nr:endonuclease/exonuclease/phosphatase family protein [Opitutaceae bacterium]